ncbi:MAG: hypothetical protein Q9202_005492 [Teloschistes flavicans]
MSAVSRQFGDVLHEIDESPVEKQSTLSFDVDRLHETTSACRAVLEDIKSSISKATGHVATDPDYLDRMVRMSPRERAAYGLTVADLRRFALRVGRGTAELRLQKEQLCQQMTSSNSSSTDQTSIESDLDVRQREREISTLVKHLDYIESMMSRLKNSEQNPQRANEFADAHLDDLDYDPDWFVVETNSHEESIRERLRRRRRPVSSETSSSEHGRKYARRRKATKRPSTPEAKQRNGGSKAKEFDVKRSDEVEESITSPSSAPASSSRDAPIYIALQHNGFVLATSTRGRGTASRVPVSQEELSQLVIQQRLQRKDVSTLTNFPLLNRDIQDSLSKRLEHMGVSDPHREWTIESIDIRKGRRTHLSRSRRQQSEQALVILSGRPLTDQRDSPARLPEKPGIAILP